MGGWGGGSVVSWESLFFVFLEREDGERLRIG